MSKSAQFMNFGGTSASEDDYNNNDDNGDPEDDPLMNNLRNAFSKNKQPIDYNNNNNNNNNNTIVFPKLRQEYEQNPEEVVINHIPLHHNPDGLRRAVAHGEVDEIKRRHEEQEKRERTMMENPVYRFAKALTGMVDPKIARSIANLTFEESGGNNKNVQIIVNDGVIGSQQQQLQNNFPKQVGQFVINEMGEPERQRLETYKEVDRLVKTASVSGKAMLSDETNSTIHKTFTSLRRMNSEMFQRAELSHFLVDESVMYLFAELVAAKFQEDAIKTSGRHQNNEVLVRQRKEIGKLCMDLSTNLIFNEYKKGYVMRTVTQKDDAISDMAKNRRMVTSRSIFRKN